MRHYTTTIIGAILLIMTFSSCREDSDILENYGYDDELAWAAADTSFAAKFKIMWKGLNQNYAIWDYEAEHGVDWDAVYDEYYPQFEALDKRGKDETVTDAELLDLLKKVIDPLHDGHFSLGMVNHKTGNTLRIVPSADRNSGRDDYNYTYTFAPRFDYYVNNNEVETDADGNPIVMEFSTEPDEIIVKFVTTPGLGFQWMISRVNELRAMPSRTEMQEFELTNLLKLNNAMASAGQNFYDVNFYNSLQAQYSFLNIPGFDSIDPIFSSKGINIKYALLKGNIAYFRVNHFRLQPYLSETEFNKTFGKCDAQTQSMAKQIKNIWQNWFDTIQALHKNGNLGGVIIDVRSNGGGNIDDYPYCLGALLPEGGIQIGYLRYKHGTGRFDYSVLTPDITKTMSDPHEIITEPIVVLTNCRTISMAEMTTMGAKIISNGTVIGTRTWGARCPIAPYSTYSQRYVCSIGEQGKTPVFATIPAAATITNEKKFVEGVGIAPDIEVAFDNNLFNTTGQDTQFDRALKFIRTGE